MKLDKLVGLGVLLLSFSVSSAAKAGSWIERNPWKLKTPVVASPSYTDGYYKNVVFQGNSSDLDNYIQYWNLNVYIFLEGENRVSEGSFGNGRRWAVCHLTIYDKDYNTVSCVAVNSKGRALDRKIYRQDYRTNVYNKFIADENSARD